MARRTQEIGRRGRRMPLAMTMVACLLAGAVGPASRAHAGEVVESFPDGTPKAKYVTNEQGGKDGHYTAYHPNGKVSIEANYRADRLEGTYAEFGEDGKPRVRTSYKAGKKSGRYERFDASGELVVSSTYADDRLNGKLEAFRGKKPVSTQVWRDGEIVTVDGIIVHPVALDVLRRTVTSILAGEIPPIPSSGAAKQRPKARPRRPDGGPAVPTVPQPPPSPELIAQREGALRRLAAYRFISGSPYEGLDHEDEQDTYAQAAAELCARIGRIDHEPPNPGLSEEQFRFAERGTKRCNLAQRQDAIHAIDGYMDDSDFANEKKVGHRRWCLNPGMLVTGFGNAKGGENEFFSAMWSMDTSRTPVPDYEAVCYPARGWMPIDFFGAHRVWSVSLNPAKFPNVPKEGVEVRIYRLGADFVRPETPLELDLLAVDSGIGAGTCVIFRPKSLDWVEGAAYWVEISGLEAKPKGKKGMEHAKPTADVSLRYVVQFAAPIVPVKADDADDPAK